MGVHHEYGSVRAPGGATGFRIRHGVKGLITSSDAVLLLEEHHCDGSTFWTLPGGGVEPGELPRVALRREVREELQCGAVVAEPVGDFPYVHASRPRTVSVYTVFRCAVTERPVANEAEGVRQCRWVTPDGPPARVLPQVRAMTQQARESGSWTEPSQELPLDSTT